MTRHRFLLLALLLLALPALGQQRTAPPATTAPAPAAWDQLSTADRDALIAPLRDRWNSADAAKRQRMLTHAREWRTMTPEQRRAAHDGMRRWSHLNPEQREHARALYESMREMDPDARRALRAQWQAMTPEQKKAWLEAHPVKEQPQPKPDR
jgi:hypothetical protein